MAESSQTTNNEKLENFKRWQSIFENISVSVIILNTIPALAIFVAFFIAIYQTATFETHKDIASESDRPYDDAPYFAGNPFYQEFGNWYGVIVVLHVITGFIANLFIFIPLFITTKGSFKHKLFGSIVNIFISLLYLSGEGDETVLLAKRGYHPCSHGIDGESEPTSFSYLLFLQFTYYEPFLAETVCYGTLLIVYAKCMDKMSLLSKYTLISLSIYSITLNIGRILVLLSIIITKLGENECGDFGYNAGSAVFLLFVFIILELPSSILSVTNIRYILKNLKNTDDEYNYDWIRVQHGKNMAVTSAITTWTLYVNIFYKFNFNVGTNILYAIYIIVLYVYCVDIFRERAAKICKCNNTETQTQTAEMVVQSS